MLTMIEDSTSGISYAKKYKPANLSTFPLTPFRVIKAIWGP